METPTFAVGDRVSLAYPREEFAVDNPAVPAGSVGTVTGLEPGVNGAYVAFDDVPDHPLFALFGDQKGWAVYTDELAHHVEQEDES